MIALPRKVVMATGNKGKIAEIQRLLADSNIVVVPQSEFDFEPAEETGSTFLENAILKARQAASCTGLLAIADDSGLAVDALDGRPGVYSARYAGPGASDDDNIERLLEELAAVDDDDRGASFHCAAVAVFPDRPDTPLVAHGQWPGRIARARSGGGGFGYDPVFVDIDAGKSSAEMTPEEKNARSHRGKAFRKLGALLKEAL